MKFFKKSKKEANMWDFFIGVPIFLVLIFSLMRILLETLTRYDGSRESIMTILIPVLILGSLILIATITAAMLCSVAIKRIRSSAHEAPREKKEMGSHFFDPTYRGETSKKEKPYEL